MWKETVGCMTSNVIKSSAHDQINLEMKFSSVSNVKQYRNNTCILVDLFLLYTRTS
jgi:hypothetical protein